jgi:hypothetical protein
MIDLIFHHPVYLIKDQNNNIIGKILKFHKNDYESFGYKFVYILNNDKSKYSHSEHLEDLLDNVLNESNFLIKIKKEDLMINVIYQYLQCSDTYFACVRDYWFINSFQKTKEECEIEIKELINQVVL